MNIRILAARNPWTNKPEYYIQNLVNNEWWSINRGGLASLSDALAVCCDLGYNPAEVVRQ